MANVLVDENSLSGIANAIRAKSSSQATLLPSEMAQAIEDLPTGGGTPNIFMQLTEPETKKGLWLQKDAEFDNIYSDDNVYIEGSWVADKAYPLSYRAYLGVGIGNMFYMFSNSKCVKYNLDTRTETLIATCPYDMNGGRLVAIGTDIYIFGAGSTTYSGNNSTGLNKSMYKYNTLTNTYTKLSDLPDYIFGGGACAVGTDIYMFGSMYKTNGNYTKTNLIYKYNTLTDTYTNLTTETLSSAPLAYSYAINMDDEHIYITGGCYSGNWYGKNIKKYTISTGTLETVFTNFPSSVTCIASNYSAKVGKYIYIFGGYLLAYTSVAYRKVVKYDTVNNTAEVLDDMRYDYTGNYRGTYYDNKIFLIPSAYSNGLQVLPLSTKIYENKSLVIAQGKFSTVGYDVELFSNDKIKSNYPIKTSIADAWYYQNSQITDNIPTYYGNGTSWVKMKN